MKGVYGMGLRDSFHFLYVTNKSDGAIIQFVVHWSSDVVSTVTNELSRTALEWALRCDRGGKTETGKF